MTERTAQMAPAAEAGATADFERLYRANVEAVTAYFARRSADPHVVADLTADTFVAVITGFGSFDPRKGTARAWVFGIARRVYASHCEAYRQQQHKVRRLAGRRDLDPDEVGELLDRIDAERAARDLVAGLAMLPERDRAVIELVDIAGLRPKEAAAALGLPPGTVRIRFADQLYADLMREHGPALAHTRPPAAPQRHIASRRALLAAGCWLLAAGCWLPRRRGHRRRPGG